MKVFGAAPIRRNRHPEQFIVLDLEGIEAGHSNLESSDPLRKRKFQVEEIAR